MAERRKERGERRKESGERREESDRGNLEYLPPTHYISQQEEYS